MPATEQTWYSPSTLHRVFAVSGVILLFSTIWMFVADHEREWKPIQRKANTVEMKMTDWRELQYKTEEANAEREKLEQALAAAQRQPLGSLDKFKAEVLNDPAAKDPAAKKYDFSSLDAKVVELENAAEEDKAAIRESALDEIRNIISKARFREETLLGNRKFKSAERDAAVGALGLLVRDAKPLEEEEALQAEIDQITSRLSELTRDYRVANEHREDLDELLDEMTRDEDEAQDALDKNLNALRQLETANKDRRSTYVTWYGPLPLPGKKWLELPILDAFNSPRQIDNLWSEGLEIDYNFRKVRRFDRCTTCHKLIDKSMPGTADMPAYVHEGLVNYILMPPAQEQVAAIMSESTAEGETPSTAAEQLDRLYGLQFSAEGLLEPTDVTVRFIRPESLAANATVELDVAEHVMKLGEDIRGAIMQPGSDVVATPDEGPGLAVGDVIYMVEGDPVSDPDKTLFRFLDAAESGEAITVTVRRGLPNPYTSHPRLDLYVGSLSPHQLSEFACSICHEGQGSATEFKWASHAPDSARQLKDWKFEHGWFDNHHWIYPMYPKRFAESSCLKCHHGVSELEPSERFPEPPAPKLMHGYNLVRKYGCYGCHEINGYDAGRQIGPDMRIEPNAFAAALAFTKDDSTGFDKLAEAVPELADWVDQLIDHPERDDVRRRAYEVLLADATSEQPMISAYANEHLTPLFKDVDSPGSLRKVGPTLRFTESKLTNAFMYDWIHDPAHFRPTTRMPRFYDLTVDPHGLEDAGKFEPVEILGMVKYLKYYSQGYEYLEPPANTSESSAERGKWQFQTRGCLACHQHKDFPDAELYRTPGEIVQGPDLSGISDKFAHADGEKWLYSWIKHPSGYNPRTVMPDLYLDPITDAEGNSTDPAADIVAYLLENSSVGWKPLEGTLVDPSDPGLATGQPQDGIADEDDLNELTETYLRDTYSDAKSAEFASTFIPDNYAEGIKGAEAEMLQNRTAEEAKEFGVKAGRLSATDQKLVYVGRKTIAKHGCYGCHDIPGFEDAKPIGTGLADWGRKDPSKLAFEHIIEYLEGHGHGHSAHEEHGDSDAGDSHAGDRHAGDRAYDDVVESAEDAEYFLDRIESGHRAGFIYQKLREPRSYDYHKTRNKKYTERLRMPKFPFDTTDREAVVTFVLGLVADPPSQKYIYKPDTRIKALIEGRQVLAKYNCGGCHMLEPKRWDIALHPTDSDGDAVINPQPATKIYPFLQTHFPPDEIDASKQLDLSGRVHSSLTGLPAVDDSARPIMYDEEGDPVEDDLEYDTSMLEFPFDLWRPTTLNGDIFEVGILPLTVRADWITNKRPTNGGFLAKYLLPHVLQQEKKVNPAAKGTEAWGWVPPPLVNQGQKVQTGWLHDFLLNPYPIRPAVVLRMPRFNMTPAEATALANYFAAHDNAEFPYEFSSRRQTGHLAAAALEYAESAGGDSDRSRFDDAMKVVTNSNYCIKCHIVGDYEPKGSERAKAPNLALVYERLRPGYVRDWIANPKSLIPYTSMPVNIPFDASAPNLGGVSQDLYHGTSIEQLDALVDLLMNFDEYSKGRSLISPLVEETPPASEQPAAAAAGAE